MDPGRSGSTDSLPVKVDPGRSGSTTLKKNLRILICCGRGGIHEPGFRGFDCGDFLRGDARRGVHFGNSIRMLLSKLMGHQHLKGCH